MNGLKSLVLGAAATLAISCSPKEQQVKQTLAPEISAPAQATQDAAKVVIPELLPTSQIPDSTSEKPEASEPTPPQKFGTPFPKEIFQKPKFDTLSRREIAQVSIAVERKLKTTLARVLGKKCKHPFFMTVPVEKDVRPVKIVFRNKKGSHVITDDNEICATDYSGAAACGMIFNQHDGKENFVAGFMTNATCAPEKPPKSVIKQLDTLGIKKHPDLAPVMNRGKLERNMESDII